MVFSVVRWKMLWWAYQYILEQAQEISETDLASQSWIKWVFLSATHVRINEQVLGTNAVVVGSKDLAAVELLATTACNRGWLRFWLEIIVGVRPCCG